MFPNAMRLPVLALSLLLVPAAVHAQVGYPPAKSPFRDIDQKFSLTGLYSYFGGDGGRLGIGPHDGPTYGGRFEIVLGTPVAAAVTASYANLQRDIVSADDSVAKRRTGPVDQGVLMIEASLQLNITGRKTWHRMAPFLGIAAGWAGGSESEAVARRDSSGYEFGNKFYWAPAAGTRLFLTKRAFLRAEARYVSWKLEYPSAYAREPADEPSLDPDRPNAVIPDGKLEEWDGSFEYRFGLGFSF